jgi:ElaB/YqjD/DUF883 family membrane-anchored ribosome-binding protein
MNVNEEMNKMQKNFEKTRDDVTGRLNNLSFDNAKDSLSDLTKQAQHATSDVVGQAQRLNENVSKQAAPRIKQYSEFVMEYPITATIGAFVLGYVLARWTTSRS